MKKLIEIPDNLYKKLENQAEENVRSVNGEIVKLIDDGIKEIKKEGIKKK